MNDKLELTKNTEISIIKDELLELENLSKYFEINLNNRDDMWRILRFAELCNKYNVR